MFRRIPTAAALVALAACTEAPFTPPETETDPALAHAKADAVEELQRRAIDQTEPEIIPLSHPVPVIYEGVLANGHGNVGSVKFASIGESANWDYWSFCAVEGAIIDIAVHRTTSAMDPAASIWTGVTPTAEGLMAFATGNGFLTFAGAADDNDGIPHGVGGFFADARIVTVAPLTGIYTLTVFDFIGAGPPDAAGEVPYDILASGLGVGVTISASADKESLGPPNHKMHTVVLTVEASGCGAVSVSVDVSSNEPVNDRGDGNTDEDWSVTDNGDGTFDIQLRAERSGTGEGRVYSITATATDETGSSNATTVEVSVAHDRGKK